MATTPTKAVKDPLQAEAQSRLTDARRQKEDRSADIREALLFSAPHLHRQIGSASPPPEGTSKESGETTTSFAVDLAANFATVVTDAFMPQAEPWCERRIAMDLPEEAATEAKTIIQEDDPKIFDAMRASSLYAEIPKAFTPNLAIGTYAFWIDDMRPAEPIVVQAIPLRELEINIGPFGDIDDRFVVRHTKNRHVAALLPGITLPEKLAKTITDKPDAKCEIRWGFWRLWERRDNVVWQRVVMVGEEIVDRGELVGAGACPLITGRWNPDAVGAWGNGPLLQMLPDLRQLDTLEEQKLTTVEFRASPPFKYPDDSFANLENGIEAGMGYPVRAGGGNDIGAMFEPGNPDAAIFVTSELERRLKRLAHDDWPEQRGDTPPTATQWLDEMTMAQRRLGLPGASFWREGPAQIFTRFAYLLAARGSVRKVEVDGKTISVEPYNPAQRAAEMQEVAITVRLLEIALNFFPEEAKIKIDGGKTIEAIAKKLRAGLVTIRDEKQIKAAVEQMAPLVEGRAGQVRSQTGGLA